MLLALWGDVQHDVGDVVVGIPEVLPHEGHREVPGVMLNINLYGVKVAHTANEQCLRWSCSSARSEVNEHTQHNRGSLSVMIFFVC
jgi:hypothetical protein